jgi:hypothetical protein
MYGLDKDRNVVRVDTRRDPVTQVEYMPVAGAEVGQYSTHFLPDSLR